MLLTPFAANGSYIITLHSVFLQGIRVLDTLPLYVHMYMWPDLQKSTIWVQKIADF